MFFNINLVTDAKYQHIIESDGDLDIGGAYGPSTYKMIFCNISGVGGRARVIFIY